MILWPRTTPSRLKISRLNWSARKDHEYTEPQRLPLRRRLHFAYHRVAHALPFQIRNIIARQRVHCAAGPNLIDNQRIAHMALGHVNDLVNRQAEPVIRSP